jgi:transposase-like protein
MKNIISVGLVDCPRCGSPLTETESGDFRKYFECAECWLTFYFEGSWLTPGRKKIDEATIATRFAPVLRAGD